MKVEKVIKSLLAADSAVTGLVSNNVWPVVVPKGFSASKYIVFHVLNNVPQPTIDAFSSYKLCRARVQLSCYAADYVALKQLVQSARDALNFKRGLTAGVSVVSIQVALEGVEGFDDDVNLYSQPVDFFVTFIE